MFKNFTKSTFIYAIGPQVPKIISFLLLPILTKYLGPNDYAVNGIVFAYVALFDVFKDLGLSIVLNNSFFKFNNKYTFIWNKIFAFLKIWMVIFSLIVFVFLWFVFPKYAESNKIIILLIIVFPIAFFEPYSYIGRYYFQLNKKPLPFVLTSIIGSLTSLIVLFVSVVWLNQKYMSFFYATFFSGFSSFLIYSYFLKFKYNIKPDYRFNFNWIRNKLKLSFLTLPHLFAGYMLSISDRIILNVYDVDIKKIGLYVFAYNFGIYFSILGKSFQQSSGPYYMEFYKLSNENGDRKAQILSRNMVFILLVFGFLISLWMKEILQLLSNNSELRASYPIAIIIIMSYTYFPTYLYISMKLWYLEMPKKLMKVSIASGVLSIVLSLLLIPYLGVIGAAISTYLSYMFMGYSGLFYKDIKSQFKIRNNFKYYLLLNFIVLIIVFLLKDINYHIKFIVTMLLLIVSIISLLKYYKFYNAK